MLRRFLVFFRVHEFHHFSSLTSSLIFTSSLSPLLFSPSPYVVSSLLVSLRFLLWSFLSLVGVVAATVALVAAAVAGCWLLRCCCWCCVGARFGSVFSLFPLVFSVTQAIA